MRNGEHPPAPPGDTGKHSPAGDAVPIPHQAARRGPDRWIRAGAVVVVLLLAGVAAYVSYRHQLELATAHGEPEETARLIPITIDGVIVMASLVMLYCARLSLPVPRLAYLALWSGIGATLAANAAHGWPGGWTARLISAAPAAVLVIAYELLMWLIRTMRAERPAQDFPQPVFQEVRVEVPVEVEVHLLPADRFEAAEWTVEEAARAGRRPPPRRVLMERWRLEQREASQILAKAGQQAAEPPSLGQAPGMRDLTAGTVLAGPSLNGSGPAHAPGDEAEGS